MPTLNLPAPFSTPFASTLAAQPGAEFEPVARPASALGTIEGFYPYETLSDFAPGGFGHGHHRVVFMPGAFADYLALVAGGSRLSVRLLAYHSYDRELANTAAGTLKVWETLEGLRWRARATSPIPVRFCSFGAGNYRSRLHTFKSGEVVRVVERAHLFEVSIVEKPATMKARAWTV